MAVVKCRECGNQVSNEAVACPCCGIPQRVVQPPVIVHQQPPARQKKSIGLFGGCLLVLLVLFAVIVFIGITMQLTKETPYPTNTHRKKEALNKTASSLALGEADHELMVEPHYGLVPITIKLQNKLIDVLNQTDELDSLIRKGCSSAEYVAVGAPIENSALKLQHALPANDPRIYLFLGAIEKYQTVGIELLRNESKHELYAQTAAAGISKVLLLKVLKGTLSKNEEQLFDTVKQQIQSDSL